MVSIAQKTVVHNKLIDVGIDYSEQLFSTLDYSLASAGLFGEREEISECGSKFSVYECSSCGRRPAKVFHCDQRLCPACYYRQLFRFFQAHRGDLALKAKYGMTTFSISWGLAQPGKLADGLDEAKVRHKALLKLLGYKMRDGIYHIEVKYDSGVDRFEIIYHYLVPNKQTVFLVVALTVKGYGVARDPRYFNCLTPEATYWAATRHFVREHCRYPESIIAHPELIREYLVTLRSRRLIQGFGSLYRVSGGRGRGKGENGKYLCPFCGGDTHFYMRVPPDRVTWDKEHFTYYLT